MEIGNNISSDINIINRPSDDTVSSLKDSEYYQQIQGKLAESREQRGIWVKGQDKTGQTDYYLDVAKLSSKSFFTTVRTNEGFIKVPLAVKMILGEKIQLRDKVEGLMESYMKSVIQTTSHNLIMSRLGGMKMASLAFVLSLFGVPAEEIKTQKQAIEDAIAENLALFEENVYNMELLEIIGGSGKRVNAEKSVLEEIQTQILTQARRLRIDDYYTKEKILEMKIKVDADIMYKFKEEEQNIKYELDYYLQED